MKWGERCSGKIKLYTSLATFDLNISSSTVGNKKKLCLITAALNAQGNRQLYEHSLAPHPLSYARLYSVIQSIKFRGNQLDLQMRVFIVKKKKRGEKGVTVSKVSYVFMQTRYCF